jgi:hypothetical protein
MVGSNTYFRQHGESPVQSPKFRWSRYCLILLARTSPTVQCFGDVFCRSYKVFNECLLETTVGAFTRIAVISIKDCVEANTLSRARLAGRIRRAPVGSFEIASRCNSLDTDGAPRTVQNQGYATVMILQAGYRSRRVLASLLCGQPKVRLLEYSVTSGDICSIERTIMRTNEHEICSL